MTDPAVSVSLDEVADDAVELIRTFRDNGSISFQDLPLERSRAAYLASCRANGLPSAEVGDVETLSCPVAGGEIAIRLYRPPGMLADAVLPLVLFVHGGGWVLGDLDTHDPICRTICRDTGLIVAAIDYRRAPEHPFPVPAEDCRQAVAWLADQAGVLNLDVSRAIVFGDSAGAGIATWLASPNALLPAALNICGQVLLYPVTDLSAEWPSYTRLTAGFPLTASSMRWFAGLYVAPGTDRTDPRLSPLLGAERRQPPLFIVTVGLDPLCDEGIAFAAAASRGGTHVEHHHMPRHAHGLFTSAGRIATGARLLHRACAFIEDIVPVSGGGR